MELVKEVVLILILAVFGQVKCDGGAAGLGTLVMGAISTGLTLMNGDVRTMSADGGNRNVVIEISNHCDYPLHGGRTFLQWGIAQYPAPTHIARRTREAMMFNKVPHTATGSAGMVSYRIGDELDPVRFVIVWSIPFNYIHASNWFGIKILYNNEAIQYRLFEDAWYDQSWGAGVSRRFDASSFEYAYSGVPAVVKHHQYYVSATMSDFGRSIIKVSVEKIVGVEDAKRLFRRKKKSVPDTATNNTNSTTSFIVNE